ncbi:MAG: glycosyltransferase family 4 protein [Patescibacteria group bacterium]
MEGKKYNILVITELFPNDDFPYLGSFVYNQLNYLKKYYNFTIICPQFFGFKIFYKKKTIKNDFTIHRMRQPILPLSIIRKIFNIEEKKILLLSKYITRVRILSLAKKINIKEHFNLIIGHESGIGDEACYVGANLNIPSIFHLHGIYNYHLDRLGSRSINNVISNIEQAKNIVSVSKIAIESYFNGGLQNKKVSIIPNLLSKTEHIPDLRKDLKEIVKNKKVILSVGWLVKEKKIEQIIRLAHRIKEREDFIILIVGQGGEYNNHNKMIKSLGLENIVYLVGAINPEKMNALYNICDFLIHPSIVDSFSMVCLEAMGNRKPIICTKNIGMAEYIKNGKEGFIVEPENDKQLQQRVLELLNDDSLRKSMGDNAFKTASNFYSEIIGEKIKEVYDRAIKSK